MLYDPQSTEIDGSKIPPYVGFEVELAGLNVSDLEECIPFASGFTAVRDDSIKVVETEICPNCSEPHKVVIERYGAELVSPKIKISELDTALTTWSSIVTNARHYGAHVNVTTGAHVHVDASLFSQRDLARVLDIHVSVENAAYGFFTGDLKEPRVKYVDMYNFAKSMRRFVEVNRVREGDDAFLRMDDKYWGWYVSRSDHNGNCRYTIEYRLFNSTVDRDKLQEMIHFALGCSYLGLTGVKAGSPSYFRDGIEPDAESVQAVQSIVQIGGRLVNAACTVCV